MKNSYKSTIEKLLKSAGIEIDGKNPYDIQIHNADFYQYVLQHGSIGLGESYMNGWWDSEQLDVLMYKILSAELEEKVKSDKYIAWQLIKANLFNQQSKSKAVKDISSHYNIGNELYEAMLDKKMMYSCGYWEDAVTLDQAQENKIELICQKLNLKPGLRVLEIGCGWGGFAQYAAENYQVEVVGVTISTEQAELAMKRCKGLNVEIRLQDYRELNEKFDRIVSIGMFEHVGHKNYKTYMDVVNRNLKKDGISLLHTVGSNNSSKTTDPWIDKYIFPNSLIPSLAQISTSMEDYFVVQDVHNFGLHYDYTLMAWSRNFQASWEDLKEKYNEEFYRMWMFYLNSCAASFRCRKNNLLQVVFTKKTYPHEYKSIRQIKKHNNMDEVLFQRNDS